MRGRPYRRTAGGECKRPFLSQRHFLQSPIQKRLEEFSLDFGSSGHVHRCKLDGAYITSRYSADDPSPEARAFSAAYKNRFGDAPDQTAALAYDATRILAEAVKRSGNDRTKLRDALQQTANFAGLTGVITIDASRNASRPAIIFKLQDGKVYPVYKEQ